MHVETVHSVILDYDERKMVRSCMSRCQPLTLLPVELSEDDHELRNKLMEGDGKYTLMQLKEKVLPYLEWLLGHYVDQVRSAKANEVEHQFDRMDICVREELILLVEKVQKLFNDAVMSISSASLE